MKKSCFGPGLYSSIPAANKKNSSGRYPEVTSIFLSYWSLTDRLTLATTKRCLAPRHPVWKKLFVLRDNEIIVIIILCYLLKKATVPKEWPLANDNSIQYLQTNYYLIFLFF